MSSTVDSKQRARSLSGRDVRVGAMAAFACLGLPAAASPPHERSEVLADELRRLYPRVVEPWERWRRDRPVRMSDGREVPREEAWRDDPDFATAARRLLSSAEADDAALGAWLLGTAGPRRAGEARAFLADALAHRDPRVAFEAVLAIASLGATADGGALAAAARSARSAEVRAAAAWASSERETRGPSSAAASSRAALTPEPAARLAPAFRRGVSWWVSEARADAGRASFRRLAGLGVTWVSIHTWDPLQRAVDDPVLAARSGRFSASRLAALVRSAHEAGLKVLFKPHLEMRGYDPSPEERRILRGPDRAARRRLVERIEARDAGAVPGSHNRIAMRSEGDWRRWFAEYEAYILEYARAARVSGADMLCVGRELDSTVIERERDWRRLLARVRAEFAGPLVYSANFDTWSRLDFWDALDFIGVSAYFPLSARADPPLAELEAGWARALLALGEASRRFDRPVLLTEAGFPSVASAARAPWREERAVADVWLQSRCYEATLRAVAAHPFVEGAFFWLWERSSMPPFRDPSHTIVGKPASFTMARWYWAR